MKHDFPRFAAVMLWAMAVATVLPIAAGAFPRPVPQVVTAVVTEHAFRDRIEALGTAQARESVTLTSKVTETVRVLHFTDGAMVQAGDLLAELTNAEQSAQLAEARADLAEAQRQYERVLPLVAKGTVSEAQRDTQLALRDTARARVAALEARLSDLLIKAPFAGRVGLRRISPGTLVQPGDPIVTLDDITTIKLDFTVPETQMGWLAPGQPVVARSQAFPGRVFHGQVATLDSRVDPVTRAVMVRAVIDNPKGELRPGMLLAVVVTAPPRPSLRIPEEALVPEGVQQYVYTINSNSEVVQRAIVIGQREPGFVEVQKGLAAGEQVITEGTIRVRPGQKVNPNSTPHSRPEN